MFGKTRELNDGSILDGSAIGDFFGDESAAAEVVRVDELRNRIAQVESQISSQFTSLATYAQIAQEQIELTRAESKASTERSEHRLTELIERERADRIEAMTSGMNSASEVVSIGSARSAMDERLDVLERSVAQIKSSLDECFAQQLALADAINSLFEQRLVPAPVSDGAALDATTLEAPRRVLDAPVCAPTLSPFAPPDPSAPISGLSLRLDIA